MVEAIRAEAARQGVRYRDLAAKMGRSDAWVSRRLSPRGGERTPLTLAEVAEFAAALGVTPDSLIQADPAAVAS